MNPKTEIPWVAVMSLCLMALIFMAVYAVLFTPGYSEQLKTVVVTAVISGGLGGFIGYWLNSSADAAKKEEPAKEPA